MFFTFIEIIYLVIMVLAIGYVFSGFIQRPVKDPLERVLGQKKRFDWQNIKYAMLIAAPGIVLHELAHKFVALGFGLSANFFIWPTGLILGIVLKLIGSGFILLAPGYVSIIGATPFQSAITSLAGPLINGALWLGCYLTLKYKKKLLRKQAIFLGFTGQINKWLFIFNMIPIPPLDGSKVLFYLIGII